MKKEREIKRYYKTAFFKGRGMFARFADFLAFRIIAFILLYVWFSSAVKNDILKILLPLISLSILSVAAELLKSIRFERFTAAEKNRLKTEILCERFTLLPKQELFKLVREYTSKNPDRFPFDCSVSVLQKTSPITTDDLLAIYQNTLKRELCHAAVFCTAVVSKEALAFAKKQKNEITLCFITASDMAEFIKYNISDDVVDDFILSKADELREKRKQALSEPFAEGSSKRYFIISALLITASFFVRYPLYYRITAMLAASFGTASLFLNRRNRTDS